ncbi:MAG: DNA gyrase inhibitor YacG [Sphingomonas sp.]
MTRAKPCPFCGKHPARPAFAPFCSEGCRARDLLQWLDEGYRLPAGPAGEDASTGLDSDGDAG